MSKQVVTYLRSSSSESQARQHHSIPAQRQRVQDWAKRSGATIVREFIDKDSGKDFNRPAFARMLKYVRDYRVTITHVICTDVTRFGREGAEYLQLVKRLTSYGVELNFVEQWFDFGTPETWSIFYFMIGNAEAERLRISKRTRETKAAIRATGYYADNAPAPYRYSDERDANGRKLLIPDEPAFSYYRRALRLYAQAEVGQAEAIKRVSDAAYEIRTSSFSRLIRNPVIAGYVPTFNDAGEVVEMVPGKHEALVSWEQYEAIQSKLNRKRPAHAAKPKRRFNERYPLKQLMWCPSCGSRVRAYTTINRHGTKYPYYDCQCHTYRLRLSEAHETLAAALNTFSVPAEKRDIVARAADRAMATVGLSTSKAQGQAKRRLNELQAKAERIKADYMKLGAEMYAELMSDVKREERQITSEMERIEQSKSINADTRRRLITLLDNFGDWWLSASPRNTKRPAWFSHRVLPLKAGKLEPCILTRRCASSL